MNGSILIATLFASIVIAPATSWALMPPMEAAEMKAESTNIVRGKIVGVECTGEFSDNKCVSKTGYVAKLDVKRNIKGKLPKDVELHFRKYDFKEGCVGSPDALHFPGDEATYYLRCEDASCRLTHWNGIEDKKSGGGKLPTCRGKGR